MSLSAPTPSNIDGSAFQVGIVAACYNEKLINGLLVRVLETLHASGVKEESIRTIRVPGSHEVPWAAGELARSKGTDVVIALGLLIGGDTNHHEMVGQSVSHALQSASLATRVPIINGVIVTNNLAQAKARTIGRIDRGAEFAYAALEMAALRKKLSS